MRTNKFSKKCFFQALLKLNETIPYNDILITDICREAGYNRSTFYRIYPSKEALLLDGFKEQYVNEYFKSIPQLQSGYGKDYLNNVRLLFRFIRQNHRFFEMMKDAHLMNEMFELFYMAFPHTQSENPKEHFERIFQSAGYLYVIYDWLDNGMLQSDELMAKYITEIIEEMSIYKA